jgi:ATP-dependent Lon protease
MDDTAQAIGFEIQKLEAELATNKLPPELQEKAKSMLAILKISIQRGGNYSNIESVANYIDTVSKIPFSDMTADNLDLNKAKEALNKNHYGLEGAKDRILEYLASLMLNIRNNKTSATHAPILCLVGLVGTGKTTLAYSIAQALGRRFERIPLGGMGDVRALRGQSRVYSDAEPGQIIKKLIHAKAKNAVVLLDELDRVTDDARADIMGALVELLDPEQNMAFVDHYVDYPVDLSNVLFVATANNTTHISTAVMDRLEVIQMPAYSDQEKIIIGKSYLLPKIEYFAGLPPGVLKIEDDVWSVIIRPLGYDSGIRSLERTIEGICRKVARFIVEGRMPQGGIIVINSKNVKEFLNL